MEKTIDVIRGWKRKTALHDHAVAVSGTTVADGAIDFEALATALENGARDRERKRFDEVGGDLAAVKGVVLVQLAARDGVGDHGAGGHVIVLEKIAAFEGFAGGLVEHV